MTTTKKVDSSPYQPSKLTNSSRYVFRPKLIQTSLCMLILASAFGPVPIASAATVAADITLLKPNTNSVYLEFSVPLADSDVLFKTGFESGDPQLKLDWHGTGNQTYIDTGTSRGTALQLTDIMSTNKGNFYDTLAGQTGGQYSISHYGITSIKADSKLSLQYDVKSTGSTNNVRPFFGNFWKSVGEKVVDNSGNIVKFKNATSFTGSTAPTKFYVTTDSGTVNLVNGAVYTLSSSSYNDYKWGYLYYTFNSTDNSMTLRTDAMTRPSTVSIGGTNIFSTGEGEAFAAEAPLIQLANYGDISVYNERNGTRDWETLNNSFDLPTTNYNPEKYGAEFNIFWQTNGQLQMDNIKIGYAEKAIIYRNGDQIYSGYDSNYTDTGATDHRGPDPVPDESLTYNYSKQTKQVIASWAPATDRGTYYNYQIQGQLRDGTVGEVHPAQTALVTSGVKGYIVTTDKSFTTQITSGAISTTTTSYTFTPTEGDAYIHIAPVDYEGNIGETKTMMLLDGDPPLLTLTPSTLAPTQSDVLISVDASDNTTWITNTTLPNGATVMSGNTSFVVNANGMYTVTTQDFFGNTTSKSITVSNIDRDRPVIAFTPNGSEWQPNTLDVDVLTEDRTLNTVKYVVNEESTRPDENADWSQGSETFSVSLPAAKEGVWYIHVVATDAAGNESYSRSKSFKIKALPAQLSNDEVHLHSYSADSITGVLPVHSDQSYEIENTTTGTKMIIPAGSSTFADTNLSAGTIYDYVITPINASGRGPSTTFRYLTLPAAATFDGAYAHSETSVEVKLEPVQSATEYLYTLTDANGEIVSVGTMDVSHIFSGLLPNNKYTVSTQAINSSGQSLESRYTFLTLPSLSHLHVVTVGVDHAKLSWDTVSGDVYYDVKRNDQHLVTVTGETYSTVSDVTYHQYELVYTGSNVSFGDYHLASGTAYNYAIAVTNETGQSNFKNVSLWTLPDAPDLYKRNTATEAATYAWNSVRGAKGYDVYLDGAKVAETDRTTYEFTHLQPGSVHSVAIVPFNDFGTGEGAHASFITLSAPATDLQLKNITSTSATVSFAPVEGAASYIATVNGLAFTSTTSEINLIGLTAGESYTIHVQAMNESGASTQSTISFQTLPLAPQSSQITSNTNDDFNLSFTRSFGAQSYRIYDGYGQYIATTKDLEVTLPSPGAGISALFGIAAVGKNGESSDLRWITYQGAAVPSEEQVMHLQNVEHDSVTITWKPFKGAVSYNLYHADQLIGNVEDSLVTVDQLLSSTEYNDYAIRAVNATGILSNVYHVAFETKPYSNFDLNVAEITTSTATINVTDGRDSDIYVFANEKGEIQRSQSKTLTIQNLSAAHSYTIKIWSENESGVRSFIHSIHFKTKEKNIGNVSTAISHPSVGQIHEQDEESPQQDMTEKRSLPTVPAEDYSTTVIRFTDVISRYSENAINFLADRGIINGDDTGKFHPQAGITRAEFLSMLLRSRDEQHEVHAATLPSSHMFHDIDGKWYTANVQKAAEMKYISGYPDGTFKPDKIITRAEAAKILQNFMNQEQSQSYEFTDKGNIPSWAKSAIDQLGGELFIGYENGQFKPQRKITKEETAVVIYRLLNK
ncbi:S-layer homology domain-containing protein [Paenibacillus sp. WLX1005]|uniref:S-layer homology domain-containing protein n=1 Tax=Paenibacillus sp. WLX1005 TaxID=3243766 RepID=UPI003984594D